MAGAAMFRSSEAGTFMMPAIVPAFAGGPRRGGECLVGCRVSNGFGANDADGPRRFA